MATIELGSMEKEKESPYAATIGRYVPCCGGRILFNNSGDHSIYYSILFVMLTVSM